MLWSKRFGVSFYISSWKLVVVCGNSGTIAGQIEKLYKRIMFSPCVHPTDMLCVFKERYNYSMNHINLVFSRFKASQHCSKWLPIMKTCARTKCSSDRFTAVSFCHKQIKNEHPAKPLKTDSVPHISAYSHSTLDGIRTAGIYPCML